MVLNYPRRWWVRNRLYHFSLSPYVNGVNSSDFVDWISGLDIRSRVPSWQENKLKTNFIATLITKLLFPAETIPEFRITGISRSLKENIDRGEIDELSGGMYICLNHIGVTTYSVSYLLFESVLGNAWIKAIGIGIIMILVTQWIKSSIVDGVCATVAK